jgi:hypothetical protein
MEQKIDKAKHAKQHNKRFSELQDKYLLTRNERYLSMMYRICVEIAANYIRKYARERRLFLNVDELSHDSAVYVIAQYLKKPEFKVERISAYIHYGCIKCLYRDKEWDKRKAAFEDYLHEAQEEYNRVEAAGMSLGDEPETMPAVSETPDARHEHARQWKQGLLFEEEEA